MLTVGGSGFFLPNLIRPISHPINQIIVNTPSIPAITPIDMPNSVKRALRKERSGEGARGKNICVLRSADEAYSIFLSYLCQALREQGVSGVFRLFGVSLFPIRIR